MTCIVGLVEKDTIWMGGDSAGVGGYALEVRADEKVCINGSCLMGFTTSFRMGQLLQHSLTIPRRHPEDSIEKFMVTSFIDAVRSCLKTGGYATTKDGGEAGGCFLVGYEKRLFRIDNDYQVGEMRLPFAAVGCGEELAKGALYALRDSSMPPEEKIRTALSAAEQFSAGVRGPFTILKLEGK